MIYFMMIDDNSVLKTGALSPPKLEHSKQKSHEQNKLNSLFLLHSRLYQANFSFFEEKSSHWRDPTPLVGPKPQVLVQIPLDGSPNKLAILCSDGLLLQIDDMCYKITDSQAHMAQVLDMRHVLQDNMVTSSRELRAPDDSLIMISDQSLVKRKSPQYSISKAFLTLALLIASL